jgi:DNA mismatch endonuclease (patch repair protein)
MNPMPHNRARPRSARVAGDEKWKSTARSLSLARRVSRHTKPELALRQALHRLGLRFRLHRRIASTRMSVDILLPRYRIAIFCDGCFWHRHDCRPARRIVPSGVNAAAWGAKSARVSEAEQRAHRLLSDAGYTVLRFWECEVLRSPNRVAQQVLSATLQSAQFGDRLY